MDIDRVKLRDLVPPSTQEEMEKFQWVEENYPQIIDRDGRQELIDLQFAKLECDEQERRKLQEQVRRAEETYGFTYDPFTTLKETTILRYERIIKLTWGHFLGIEQGMCYLYSYGSYPEERKLLAELRIEGTITLDKVMVSLAKTDPEKYNKLSELLYKDVSAERYISYYRCFNVVFGGDVELTFATIRVLIDNDFNKTYLDVVGILTGKQN